MIDTQEPKNGDFARYVENLSRLPPGQGQVIGPRAPGSQSDEDAQPRREQLKALRKALEERKQQALAGAPDSLFGRAASGTGGASKAADIGQLFQLRISTLIKHLWIQLPAPLLIVDGLRQFLIIHCGTDD